MTDLECLKKILEKDPQGLAALYDRFSGAMFTRIVRILRIESLAEEVLQEVFLEVWNKADLYQSDKGRVSTWLLTLARNRAIDRLRKRQRREGLTSEMVEENMTADGDSQEDIASMKQSAEHLREQLSHLPAEQKMVIEKCFFQGFTVQETADDLNLPLGTVKTRLRLGMQKLRSTMMDEAA